MKNYIIAALLVIILVLSSLLYRQNKTSVPQKFPALEETATQAEVPLILYVFFKKNNCHDCLEIIEVLNDLPPHFVVLGIVPQKELKDEKELRSITGARFPLAGHEKYRRFIPWYTPSIVGVSPNTGRIILCLPAAPGSKDYLVSYLESLYAKLYPVFLKNKLGQ